jgi:hypothetical protein
MIGKTNANSKISKEISADVLYLSTHGNSYNFTMSRGNLSDYIGKRIIVAVFDTNAATAGRVAFDTISGLDIDSAEEVVFNNLVATQTLAKAVSYVVTSATVSLRAAVSGAVFQTGVNLFLSVN